MKPAKTDVLTQMCIRDSNPVSIIIPCHRVVGAGGSLTGYAGGLDRKIWLLDHEGVDVSRFSVPVKGTAL